MGRYAPLNHNIYIEADPTPVDVTMLCMRAIALCAHIVYSASESLLIFYMIHSCWRKAIQYFGQKVPYLRYICSPPPLFRILIQIPDWQRRLLLSIIRTLTAYAVDVFLRNSPPQQTNTLKQHWSNASKSWTNAGITYCNTRYTISYSRLISGAKTDSQKRTHFRSEAWQICYPQWYQGK